jgi:hypothetical protein
MLSLLTTCNDVVTSVSGLLGYVPYHPLWQPIWANTQNPHRRIGLHELGQKSQPTPPRLLLGVHCASIGTQSIWLQKIFLVKRQQLI